MSFEAQWAKTLMNLVKIISCTTTMHGVFRVTTTASTIVVAA